MVECSLWGGGSLGFLMSMPRCCAAGVWLIDPLAPWLQRGLGLDRLGTLIVSFTSNCTCQTGQMIYLRLQRIEGKNEGGDYLWLVLIYIQHT